MEVRTRIAPSPTGKLHIGTARTALFNYLYAKKNKGKFFLRFEDTDQKRSTKGFEKDIEENLKWLGLFWDDDPVYQMKRLNVYTKKAKELLDKGFAYEKDKALWLDVKKVMTNLGISGREVEARRGDKIIKSTLIELPEDDLIQGRILGNVEDFVIMRSNGIPTFHFAVVIDDNDMGITHVIRGADHFANTPKHYLLYKILGYKLPKWAHISLTLNEDKSKLSKRKGSVSVSDFKKEGYLPEALNNFIVLLGWHPKDGNEREFFTQKDLIKEFSIEDMNKANAIFDKEKLDWFQRHYISQVAKDNPKKFRIYIADNLKKIKQNYNVDLTKEQFSKIIQIYVVNGRINFFDSIYSDHNYLFQKPEYKKEILIFKKSDIASTKKGLNSAIDELRKLNNWPKSPEQFKELLQQRMEKDGLSFGDMFWPVRVALSGREQSPGPDELLWVLGKEESLKRLEKAINLLK